ncbi:transcriptional regulator, XRE family [Fibrisoma limi BUZ 3]|uniref:Transcriptional regulator, XRE family n=1 Tax=Fibrisoma limi BUZ 3 TaxID=1185876 RepID=I2GHL7_9BACT|nr:helix-turn-helix transcriptional regulator [Fibrisoma limi]CCH53392.1 transcriptional regulator, XRE family [Fibrisoma limi BUZ 3]
MTINDKIKQILIDKNLSPSYFADEIGVQRSSISHILSGRNRPSFDIIQKIIRRFPELGYEWIMEDDASGAVPTGYNRPVSRLVEDRQERPVSFRTNGPATIPSVVRSQRSEIAPIPTDLPATAPETTTPSISSDKKVERILIFYTDGTFREYSPSLS